MSSSMRRQLPRWSELRPLLGVDPPALTTERRLAAAATIPDLRRLAARRTPRAPFDYVDGAAEDERTLWRSRMAYRRTELQPSVLRGVGEVDLTATVLGVPSALPVVLAPTGFTRMMHAAGEPAVARAAAAHGVPYALSTLGTTSPAGVRDAAPDGRHWFQLYVLRDRDMSEGQLDRARDAGFDTLVLTVDTTVAGRRLRDVHNGLTIPPRLTLRTLGDMALHPSWWFDVLTTEPLEFAAMHDYDGTVAELVDEIFDPSVTDEDFAWLRDHWDGPVVVKGIQTVDDALRFRDLGAAALVVSNHGGRQLDRTGPPLLLVPDVVEAVGDDVEVYVDGGILGGTDVAVALAAGADAVMVGRAYLYGLMAGGQAGVERMLEILTDELARACALLGVARVTDLAPEHVSLPTAVR